MPLGRSSASSNLSVVSHAMRVAGSEKALQTLKKSLFQSIWASWSALRKEASTKENWKHFRVILDQHNRVALSHFPLLVARRSEKVRLSYIKINFFLDRKLLVGSDKNIQHHRLRENIFGSLHRLSNDFMVSIFVSILDGCSECTMTRNLRHLDTGKIRTWK